MEDIALPNFPEFLGSLGGVLADLVKWTVLGVVGGLVLAILTFIFLRKLGWYGQGGRIGRVLLCFLMIVALAILGGVGGHALGFYYASERALKNSPVGKEVLPRVGEVCADFLLLLDAKGAGEQPEMNVKEFVQLVRDVKETAAKSLMVELKQKALNKNPDWNGGLAEDVLEWGLQRLSNAVLDKRIEKLGLPSLLMALEAEAAKKGDPHTIARADLIVFFSDEIILPGLLQPVRSYVRGTLIVVCVIALVVIFGPVLLIRLSGRKQSLES